MNTAARAVSKTPRLSHISPILKYLHWLKIDHRIPYKVLSLTYKTLLSQKPPCLYNLLNLQIKTQTQVPSNRSSCVVTLQRHPVNSRLKITDRLSTYHTPALWNILPKSCMRCLGRHTSSINVYHALLITFSLSPHLSFTP